MINEIINKDCLTGLKELPDCSIDCCVTSPPYFGLRDYGHEDQAGLEETPELYVENMVAIFTEVKRVLKKEGTLWLNLGDSYSGSTGKSGGEGLNTYTKESGATGSVMKKSNLDGYKPKDLIGIPWMVAFALRSSGWYLRQDIIWHKPNPMPESVTDRCTKSHEYVFLLSKSVKYYYDADAIKTTIKDSSVQRLKQNIENQKGSDRVPGKTNGAMKAVRPHGIVRDRLLDYDSKEKALRHGPGRGEYENEKDLPGPDDMANKKSVWTVTTRPYSEAHFATFPERLIIDMIKAGCPEFVCSKCGVAREMVVEKEFVGDSNKRKSPTGKDFGQPRINTNTGNGMIIAKEVSRQLSDCGCNAGFSPGIVLDPFMGAGTTALVARKLGRNYIGFEINPDYIKIANKRLKMALGMFL